MTKSAEKIVLEVESRGTTGKNACRRLRASGRIPGNVYGLDRPPFMVAVSPRRIEELLRLGSGVNTVFHLNLQGEERTREAMIRELQRNPLSGRPVHVDFVRVDPTRRIQVHVPVRLVGIPEGVKNESGIIDFVHREVHVECLPSDIPEHLSLDVTHLHLHQHVSVKDIPGIEGLRVLDDPEQIVAVVSVPKAEEVPVAGATEEAAAAEPELVKKGKEAGEGESPAGAKDKEKEKEK
jgi:large subunit ribosomal protein L25